MRSRSRSGSPERIDRFGRVIPKDRKRSRSRSPSHSSRHSRRRSRSRSRSRHSGVRSRSRSHSHSRGHSSSRRSYRSPERYGPKSISNRTDIEDPRFLNARVFIGNLPVDKVSKTEIETLFKTYGKILGKFNEWLFIRFGQFFFQIKKIQYIFVETSMNV